MKGNSKTVPKEILRSPRASLLQKLGARDKICRGQCGGGGRLEKTKGLNCKNKGEGSGVRDFPWDISIKVLEESVQQGDQVMTKKNTI